MDQLKQIMVRSYQVIGLLSKSCKQKQILHAQARQVVEKPNYLNPLEKLL